MGNLLGALRYREPSTVEECDSTWETDSERDEQDSGVTESGHCGDEQDGVPQVQPLTRKHQ